jgi:hypothetical protein
MNAFTFFQGGPWTQPLSLKHYQNIRSDPGSQTESLIPMAAFGFTGPMEPEDDHNPADHADSFP